MNRIRTGINENWHSSIYSVALYVFYNETTNVNRSCHFAYGKIIFF
jgi:hypothetical protein